MKPIDFLNEGKLLIGVTGAANASNIPGYLAYFKLNICKNIKVILTKNATRFVNISAIGDLCDYQVFTDENEINKKFNAPHISLTRWADILLILPSSANILSKTANGIADDLLSTTILSSACPVIFYPNINIQMWEKRIMKENVDAVSKDYYVKYKKGWVYEIASGNKEEAIIPSFLPEIINIKNDIFQVLHQYNNESPLNI